MPLGAGLPESRQRFRRVDVSEDGVVDITFADEIGMLADQMLGADIAGEIGHGSKEPPVPQHRITALAVPGRDADRAAL